MGAHKIITAALAAALVVTSTEASAASQPAPQPQSSWLALSMLTPGGSIGLGGAAAQLPPPDNAPAPQAHGAATTPPVPVIAIWLATLAMSIYILTREHHGHFVFPRPGSPA